MESFTLISQSNIIKENPDLQRNLPFLRIVKRAGYAYQLPMLLATGSVLFSKLRHVIAKGSVCFWQ
jgi:hypothetical protein